MNPISLLLLLLVPASVNAATLQVTVYNKTGVANSTLDSTIHIVQSIFRQAGIHLDFRNGDLSSEDARKVIYVAAATSPDGQRRLTCEARREIALDLTLAPSFFGGGLALGIAYPLAATGLNVRIFTDRVSHIATRNARAFTTVLANVIAHEIGHVLMRSVAHEKYGIMAADWSQNEFEQMAKSRFLFFDRRHVRQMQATLSREGCESPLAAAILNPR